MLKLFLFYLLITLSLYTRCINSYPHIKTNLRYTMKNRYALRMSKEQSNDVDSSDSNNNRNNKNDNINVKNENIPGNESNKKREQFGGSEYFKGLITEPIATSNVKVKSLTVG